MIPGTIPKDYQHFLFLSDVFEKSDTSLHRMQNWLKILIIRHTAVSTKLTNIFFLNCANWGKREGGKIQGSLQKIILD